MCYQHGNKSSWTPSSSSLISWWHYKVLGGNHITQSFIKIVLSNQKDEGRVLRLFSLQGIYMRSIRSVGTRSMCCAAQKRQTDHLRLSLCMREHIYILFTSIFSLCPFWLPVYDELICVTSDQREC